MFRLMRPCVLLALTPLSLVATAVHAQETLNNASVTGRVLDPTGAAVPRISVTALEPATNQTYTTQTDAQGRFRLPFLPMGQFRISSQAPGFAQAARAIELTVGSAFDITLQLGMAQTSSTVQVSGDTCARGDRSQIGETVLQSEVHNLPLRAATISISRFSSRVSLRRILPARRPSPRPRR